MSGITLRIGRPPQGPRRPIQPHWTIIAAETARWALLAIGLGGFA